MNARWRARLARVGGGLPARLASQKTAGRRFLRRAWTRRASLRLCAVQGQQGRSFTARAAEGEARPHLPRDLHQAGACAPAVLLVPFFRCFRSRSRSCSSCAWGSRPVAGGRCSCSAARARVRSRRRPAHPRAFARTQTRQNPPPVYVLATPAPHDPTFPLALAYASCPHHTTPTRQHHSCSPAIKKHACAATSPAPCLRRPLFARAFGRVALPHVLPPTLAPCPLPARRPPLLFLCRRTRVTLYLSGIHECFSSNSKFNGFSKNKQDEEGSHTLLRRSRVIILLCLV